MKLKDIFSVFSHRSPTEEVDNLPSLTESFRNRVLLLIRNRWGNTNSGSYLSSFWEDMHEKLTMSVGRGILLEELNPSNSSEDVIGFILNCSDKHFIDFLEFIFKSDTHWRITVQNDNRIVNDINELFSADNLPYHITNFTYTINDVPAQGIRGRTTRKVKSVSSYPKVILKENEVIHKTAIEPTLSILEQDDFKFAHGEFIDALTDFREGDYGDCLTKCGSSFESVMKIICHKRGWSYSQNDTSSKLLDIIFENSSLPRFYETHFILVSTIRNKISKSHGAGTKPKKPSKNIAKFSINQTASAVTFLVRELY